MNTVKLYLIWAVVEAESDAPWLVAAWDEYSMDANYDGYLEALADAHHAHGAGNIRETVITADYDKVVAAFKPSDVTPEEQP